MWHEARRQERKIRGMLVDYRRRAERRRDFYEKIKADPTQFLQIHGRQCKIHLDANIAAAADTAVMMPWQGQADNLIDRFDVRAHLDFIPPIEKTDDEKLTQDERHLNYERYRIIAQNAFLAVPEEKFLKQLHLEEQFGYTEFKTKKDARTGGAAIGFNYEDSTGVPQEPLVEEASDDENSDSDLDVDLAINVSKMDPTQANEMNKHGRSYGMSSNDFYSFLINDLEEAEAVKQAREEEQEKALFSGRKSRRERRYHREKRLANRTISPPSYAAKASPTLLNLRESKSHSRTPSPENSGKITYITSFGEDEETPSSSKPTVSKVNYGKPKPKYSNEKTTVISTNRRRSRSKSRSKDKYYNKNIRSKNNNRSRRGRTRSKSRSRRSRSNSRPGYRRHRSPTPRSHSRSYSRSRSRSRRSSRSKDRSRSFRRRHSSSSSSSSSKTSSKSSSSISSQDRSPKKKTPERNKVDSIPSPQEMGSETIPRYYGRRKNDKSSSELSDLNDEDDDKTNYESNGGDPQKDANATAGKKSSTSLTIIERLKRKRQALLNRQFKADKIAEQAKTEREKLEQQTREDELREMAIKLRKRQREKRHANDSVSSSDSDDSTRSYESNYSKERSRSRSREKDSRHHHRRSRRNSNERRDERRDERHDERRDERHEEKRDERRSTSREKRTRERRDRERDRRGRWSSSPNRGTKDRYRDDRDKVRLVNY